MKDIEYAIINSLGNRCIVRFANGYVFQSSNGRSVGISNKTMTDIRTGFLIAKEKYMEFENESDEYFEALERFSDLIFEAYFKLKRENKCTF